MLPVTFMGGTGQHPSRVAMGHGSQELEQGIWVSTGSPITVKSCLAQGCFVPM